MPNDNLLFEQADQAPQEHSSPEDAVLTLISLASLWKPRHPSTSMREMAGLPILFWLIAQLRPALTVQIGLGQGTSFLGLCQAIEQAQTGGLLLSLFLDKETLFPDQVEQYDSHYSQIASFGLAAEVPGELEDHPIQLLVLQQKFDDSLRDMWLPRLAENAVIFAHFSATPLGEAQRTLLLDSFPPSTRRISFPRDGENIDLLLIGAALPRTILHLAGSSKEADIARSLLQRLADGMKQQALARKRMTKLNAATTSLEETKAQMAALGMRLEGLQKEADAAHQAEAAEVKKAAVLQAQVFDLQQNCDQLKQRIVLREDALAQQATDLEQVARHNTALEGAVARKQSEIRYLTNEVDQSRRAIETTTDERDKLRKKNERLQKEIHAFRTSTSWRITWPIRMLKDKLRHLSKPRR